MLFLAVPLGLSALGCVDPDGELDKFQERYCATHACNVKLEAGECIPPAPGELSGQFVFSISSNLDPAKPIMFAADLTTEGTSISDVTLSMSLQGIKATDRTTLVGDTITVGPFDIHKGKLEENLPPLTVTGEANPITLGADITAEISLLGNICAPNDGGVADPDGGGEGGTTLNTDLDFFCGFVSGQVTKPLAIKLTNSTYTIERLSAPGAFPNPPKINCARDEAGPPPTAP